MLLLKTFPQYLRAVKYLETLFKAFGKIKDIKYPLNQNVNEAKVIFSDGIACNEAVTNLDGEGLAGSMISVKWGARGCRNITKKIQVAGYKERELEYVIDYIQEKEYTILKTEKLEGIEGVCITLQSKRLAIINNGSFYNVPTA